MGAHLANETTAVSGPSSCCQSWNKNTLSGEDSPQDPCRTKFRGVMQCTAWSGRYARPGAETFMWISCWPMLLVPRANLERACLGVNHD